MTTEELNLMRETPVVANVSILCDEVERLQKKVEEARVIINLLENHGAEDAADIQRINAWMQSR